MSYKLYYFNARGIAEPIRLMFLYTGVEFEDIRAPLDDLCSTPMFSQPPIEMIENTTWGKLPVLEWNGIKFEKAPAIMRFIAKRLKLVPEDDLDAAKCEEYVDTCQEIFTGFRPLIMKENEIRIPELLPDILRMTDEKYLSVFEEIVRANGHGRFVGKELTWTDIFIMYVINQVETVFNVDLLKNYPNLRQLSQHFFTLPQIQKWVQERPKTKY